MSDEEDDTWGEWTALGKSKQAPLQTPTHHYRRHYRRHYSRLNISYKCVLQVRCQAKAMIDNPNQFVDRMNTTISEAATEHSESPVADKKNETTILEVATKHSMIRRLLTLANENPKHSERPKKLGKGTASHAREKSPVPNDAADNEVSVATAVPTLTPQQMPLTPPMNSDDEIPVATTVPTPTPPAEVPTPTLLPSNDKQEPAPAPPPEQASNAADTVCTAATRKRIDSESSVTDDDYESWLQSHGYST